MQLTLNILNMSSAELELIEALIRSRRNLVLGYESPSNQLTCCGETKPQPESNQPSLPFEGEIDTTTPITNEVPAKKRTVKPKEVSTSDEKPKEVSEPTPEVKTSSVSLGELKEIAQRRVASTDRETVKATISKYADKLSEVKESDYLDLFDDLANLTKD